MPPVSSPNLPIKPKLVAAVLLLMGIAAIGGIGLIWRLRLFSLNSNPGPLLNSAPLEGLTGQPQKNLRSFFTASLRTAKSSPPSPLTIPPPVLPQPQLPQAVWPDPPTLPQHLGFVDVPTDYWAAPILIDLAKRQLIAGFPDGSFRPTASMTRAEFATQLTRLFELSRQGKGDRPLDIPADHWATTSIDQAIEMRFLNGYPDQTFRPEQEVTRLQVALALASGLNLKSSSSPELKLKTYSDYQQVPPWAQRPLVAALEANLIVNYPDATKLEPNRRANRAEVMAMLHQALVYTGRLSPLLPNHLQSLEAPDS